MTTNNPIAFNAKEELLEFSNNNDYNVEGNTENLIKFIKDNAGKFLYLRKANLGGANLVGADLWNTKGVYGLNTEYYNIYFHKKQIQIGCKKHTLEEWENFTDSDIDNMDKEKALLFWKKYKDDVFSLYKKYFN